MIQNNVVMLRCDPPLDWAAMVRFFGQRAIAGVEAVADDFYEVGILTK